MKRVGLGTASTHGRAHRLGRNQDSQGAQVVWLHKHREPKDDRSAGGPAAEHGKPSVWKLGLLAALGLLAFALAGALVFWALDAKAAWLALPMAIGKVKPALVALHFTLIGLAWWRWSRIVQWAFHKGWVHADNVKAALGMRHRVSAFFVIFEFLVAIRWPLGTW